MLLYIDLAVVSKDIFIPSKEHVAALSISADFCDAFSAKIDDLMAEKSLAVTYKKMQNVNFGKDSASSCFPQQLSFFCFSLNLVHNGRKCSNDFVLFTY